MVNQYCAHSFARNWQLPFLNQRKGKTVEKISWSISTKECCQSWQGSNPRPPGLQSHAHPSQRGRRVPTVYFFFFDILNKNHPQIFLNKIAVVVFQIKTVIIKEANLPLSSMSKPNFSLKWKRQCYKRLPVTSFFKKKNNNKNVNFKTWKKTA